jgi:putative spermidine/putrescine transport system permease protein
VAKRLLALYNLAGYVFLLAPIVVVMVWSFSDSTTLTFPPQGWSLRWFRYLAGRGEFIDAAVVSAQVAIGSSVGAVALGMLASLALVRQRVPGRSAIEALLMGPLVLPGIITGVALLQFFTIIGLLRSFERLLLAHLVICTPYAIKSISAGLYGIDPSLEEASRTLGAGPWRTFRRVLLPLLRQGLMAAFIFSFVTSFDNVVVSIYLIGADTVTLPVRILTYVEWQFDPSIAAISTIFIAVTTVLVIASERLTGGGGSAWAEPSGR